MIITEKNVKDLFPDNEVGVRNIKTGEKISRIKYLDTETGIAFIYFGALYMDSVITSKFIQRGANLSNLLLVEVRLEDWELVDIVTGEKIEF